MGLENTQSKDEKNGHFRYLIKFLSSDTLYPVVLKDKEYSHLTKYDHTIWYQHHEKNYIDIRKFESGFFGNESIYLNGTLVGNDLLLLKYQNHKNILDHYEPIHFSKVSSEVNNEISYKDEEYEEYEVQIDEQIKNNEFKKIYTLVYFDDLEIFMDYSDSNLSIECILDIIMPKFLSKKQKIYLENELRSLISFRIKFENDTNAESEKKNEDKQKSLRESYDNLQVYRAKAGPFLFKKEDFKNKKILCEILLKDYDLTNVLRKKVKSRYSTSHKNNSNQTWKLTLWNQLVILIIWTVFKFN